MVLCINAVVANHFKVFIRDMYNQPFDKVNGRDTFCNGFMILMTLITESHKIPIIGINPGGGNNRSSKVSADIFNGDIRRTQVRLGPDIKSIRMVFVDLIFKAFKGIAQFRREFI